MLERSRFFLSAALIAALFVSALILSNPLPARACPPPPPASLLSLYLKSDLIVVGEIARTTDGQIVKDYGDSFSIEIAREVKIASVFKGKPPADFVFIETEYREKAPDEPTETEREEGWIYSPYGYKDYAELRDAERYLFFFTRDEESGKYELTDRISGAKKLGDVDLGVHEKRLKELQTIAKTKKNQLFALTEWLIRCVDEPSTRWDGAFDLNRSFVELEYADEDEQDEPFEMNESTITGTPAIAKNLTAAQKSHLSSLAFDELQRGAFGQPGNYYNLINLASHWDKPRLAIYAFNLLQALDKSDSETTETAMSFISDLVDDEALAEITEHYASVNEAADSEETSDEQSKEQSPEEEPANQAAPDIAPEITSNAPPIRTAVETLPPDQKPTPAELRAQFLQDFADRFQYLVATGFQNDADAPETSEVTEN